MNQEYRLLKAFVQRVRRGLYARRLLQGGIVALTLLLAVLLLGVGVQHLIPMAPIAALLYSIAAVVVLAGVVVLVLLPALRPVTLRRVLTNIEQTYPELHDDLTNALELDATALGRSNPYGMALELVHALHRHTAGKVKQYRAGTVLRQQRLVGLSWCGTLLLAALLVTWLQPHLLAGSVHMLLHPLSYLPPREMQLTIAPQQATIARGTNLEIRAQANGRLPRTMQIHVERQGQAGKRYPMESLGQGAFRYTFLQPQSSFTFHAAASGFTSEPGAVTVVPSPAVGKLVLHYLFPEYTGLPPRTQEGGGDIQALPGTQVQLSMQANVPLQRGTLRFDDGHDVPLRLDDTALQGEILVMRPGTYVIEVEDTHGLKNLQPPRYTVQVIPDEQPTVHISDPQDGLEVDETTTLQITYEARDDFGLQDAALVYFAPGTTEQRISLHKGRFAHPWAQDTAAWDMQQWPLPAGDTVQFYLEIYDNDTISGPKKGVSQTLTLKIRNRAEEHQELEQLQQEVADALLDLLGDHLEMAAHLQEWRQEPSRSQEALQQARDLQRQGMERAEQLSERLQEALERVQNDPYSTYETFADMQAMQRNMDFLQNTVMPQLQQSMQALDPRQSAASSSPEPEKPLEQAIQELERLASLAEDVANSERLNDLMQASNKMLEQQNQLLAALDNLPQDFQGGELPPEIQNMLDELERLMQELAQAAAQLPQSLSDEFLNRQLDDMSLSSMQQQLQELRQKLAAGDLEGAKKLAEELLKMLSAMVNSLQDMQQQARGDSMNAMNQQLQQSSDKLADLVQRQEQILQETQQTDQEALQRLYEAQQKAFEAAQQQLHQELSKLTRQAWEMSQQASQFPDFSFSFQQSYKELLQRVHELRQHIDARDMPQALNELEAARRQLNWMQQQIAHFPQADNTTMQRQVAAALERLQAMQQHIDRLPQDRQAMLSPEQRAQLGKLAEQQGRVQEETSALHESFEQLMPLMPFLPAEMGQRLQDAIPFMGEAQGELTQRRSQPAIPPEQQALEHLRMAQNNLQQALQQMAQRGQMMGMSMPMLRQAGRLPGLSEPRPQVSQSSQGVAGASVRNFQLPDKEAYKVPRMFREDIVEALKEGYPARYKELIEQYYRNIVR